MHKHTPFSCCPHNSSSSSVMLCCSQDWAIQIFCWKQWSVGDEYLDLSHHLWCVLFQIIFLVTPWTRCIRTATTWPRAIAALVPQGGPVLCRDEMEEWSASKPTFLRKRLRNTAGLHWHPTRLVSLYLHKKKGDQGEFPFRFTNSKVWLFEKIWTANAKVIVAGMTDKLPLVQGTASVLSVHLTLPSGGG